MPTFLSVCIRGIYIHAGKSQSIVMNDVAASTVEMLLQYVYGCLKPELTLAEAVALFEASDMYALTSLHQQCMRLLKALISFDNVFDLAELAQLHDCPTLLQVRMPDLLILLSNVSCAQRDSCGTELCKLLEHS